MQRNKHEKLIQEWAKDTSRVVQYRLDYARPWTDLYKVPQWDEIYEYRLKPYDITFVQKIVVNKHNNHVSAYPESQVLADGFAFAKVEFTIDSETRTIKGVKLL